MNKSVIDQCEQVQLIAESTIAKAILVTKSFLSIVAACSTAYLIVKKGIGWIAHPNARFLYSLHIFWIFSISVMNFCVFLFDFIRLSMSKNSPCDRLLTVGFCMGTKMFTILGIVAQETSMLAFAFERAYATITPEKYERWKSNGLAVFMGILSILLAAGVKYGLMLPGLEFSDLTATYDVIFPDNTYLFQLSLYAEMAIELTTGVIFIVTYFWNGRLKKKAIHDSSILGKKYQVFENQKFIILLFPCFVLHFFLNLMIIFLLALYPLVRDLWVDKKNIKFFEEEYLTRFIWTECCSQPFLYGMFFPLLVLYRLKKVDRERTKAPKGYEMNTDEHFNELRKMFDGPAKIK